MNFPKLFDDFNIKYDTRVSKGWVNPIDFNFIFYYTK